MSLTAHLEELRQRLIVCAAAILLVSIITFFESSAILKILLLPSGGLQLRAFSLLDGFMIKWHIALFTGIVVAIPIWVYELYQFVSPGLYPQERRTILPALAGAIALFTVGALFGYYLLWGMIRVLIQFFPAQVQYLPSADDYISFVGFFLLACGLAFQLPTALILLVRLRILSTQMLVQQRKIAYFALFAFAEIITPVSDPIVAPLTVMIPLIVLYEASIWVAKRIEAGRTLDEALG
jgi:sec-independent protein translocase protein TatC